MHIFLATCPVTGLRPPPRPCRSGRLRPTTTSPPPPPPPPLRGVILRPSLKMQGFKKSLPGHEPYHSTASRSAAEGSKYSLHIPPHNNYIEYLFPFVFFQNKILQISAHFGTFRCCLAQIHTPQKTQLDRKPVFFTHSFIFFRIYFAPIFSKRSNRVGQTTSLHSLVVQFFFLQTNEPPFSPQ